MPTGTIEDHYGMGIDGDLAADCGGSGFLDGGIS